MRTLILVCPAIAILFALVSPCAGEVPQWPPVLGLPQAAVAVDSNGIRAGTEQSLYIRRLKSMDSLSIMKNTPGYGVNQTVDYELTNDYWSDTRDQLLDLSGEAVRKGLPLGMSAGLEWSPVLIYNKYTSSFGLLGSMEAGPVIRFHPLGVPVMIHAGGAARAWNDSLGHSLSSASYDDFYRDKGYYAGAELGSNIIPFMRMPMFLNFKGYGRSLESSRLIAGTGSVLLYHALANGDSLFGLYSDSLVNGNSVLGQYGGRPRFINDPTRTERGYEISAGYKGSTRLFLNPSAVLSYNRHVLSYNDARSSLPDRASTDYAVLAMLQTVPGFPVTYAGGFRIEWGDERTLTTLLPSAASAYALDINLDSYTSYKVTLDQCASKYFSNGIGAEYSFDISRSSRAYPNFYVQSGDTIMSNNDNDIIVNKQKLTVVPVPSSWGPTTVYYEFSKNLSNYIRSEKSGQNTIDWFYRLGGTYRNTVFQSCTLSEATSAEAKVTRYAFPVMNRGNPPPYSRKWTALTIANMALTKKIACAAEVNETYSDNGTLNGRDYLDTVQLQDTALTVSYRDYYAIVEKLWAHSVKLSLSFHLVPSLSITTGCAYQLNDAKSFDPVSNDYSSAGSAGRRISPFGVMEFIFKKHLNGKASITYNFDTKENFWDILISLNGEF